MLEVVFGRGLHQLDVYPPAKSTDNNRTPKFCNLSANGVEQSVFCSSQQFPLTRSGVDFTDSDDLAPLWRFCNSGTVYKYRDLLTYLTTVLSNLWRCQHYSHLVVSRSNNKVRYVNTHLTINPACLPYLPLKWCLSPKENRWRMSNCSKMYRCAAVWQLINRGRNARGSSPHFWKEGFRKVHGVGRRASLKAERLLLAIACFCIQK